MYPTCRNEKKYSNDNKNGHAKMTIISGGSLSLLKVTYAPTIKARMIGKIYFILSNLGIVIFLSYHKILDQTNISEESALKY